MGAVPMFIMALILAFWSKGKVQSSVYNRSRYFLIVATLLLAIHCVIQYFGHFRENNITLCWTINIAFYLVVTPFYNFAELNLLRAGRNMKRGYRRIGIFVTLCYLLLAIGYFTGTLTNDSQPYLTITFLVAVLYTLMLVELSWVLSKELKESNSRLADEDLVDRHNVLRYTGRAMKSIILISLLSPWIGMFPSLLLNSIYGMTIFFLILWFLLELLHYGDNMAELIQVNDEILEAEMSEADTEGFNNQQNFAPPLSNG